jgi:uncharacterized protein
MIDPELLKVLACPACESRPALKEEKDQLLCTQCGRAYPVRDGIPILLVEEKNG